MFNVEFELFVNGYSSKNIAVVSSLEELCRAPEFEGCSLKVINVSGDPELASSRKVLLVPVLIMHKNGHDERRIIGDLNDRAGLNRQLDRWKMCDL